MIVTIIIINCCIFILNCYLIGKICALTNKLAKFNKQLEQINNNLVLNLKKSPLLILIVALNIKKIKQSYQKLNYARQRLLKMIVLIQTIYQLSRISKNAIP